jgi:protocatechuate 3,4-dioxygenase, beta subunit
MKLQLIKNKVQYILWMITQAWSYRTFQSNIILMKQFLTFPIVVLMITTSCAQNSTLTKREIGPCEDCQLMFEGMPAALASATNLVTAAEAGEPLIIKGKILMRDGKTPATGVILYVYQTDNNGLYSKGVDQKQAVRHGHIRGWMKTNAHGEYEFKTIRPAAYPNSSIPQHIHPIVYEAGKGYYWVDDFMFEDDPFLTEKEKSHAQNRGGSGILKLKKNAGVWEGQRDIVLGLNVTGY